MSWRLERITNIPCVFHNETTWKWLLNDFFVHSLKYFKDLIHFTPMSHFYGSRHGCISDASMRRLMQHLRDISKRVDLQISETSLVRCIKGVSSEMSLRSLRSSQRRLWVASESVIPYFQTEVFFGYFLIYLRVFKYFANPKINPGYLYKRKTSLDQIVYLRFP